MPRSCWAACSTALGRPIDGLGDIYPVKPAATSTARPSTPVSRVYPRNYIHTGISSIDCLMPR